MNYYDELIQNINNLIENKDYDKAKSLILTELDVAYVPRDIEKKLKEFLRIINENNRHLKTLTDEEIENYLFKDEQSQLIAVNELDKRNIRDYLDICDKYLKSEGFKNAKALLIDSLIKQAIDYQFEYLDDDKVYKFNPKDLKIPQETDGFIEAYKIINDNYMKDPSMQKLAMDLLYKECLLYLPRQASKNEGCICANKIIKYINDAFSAK